MAGSGGRRRPAHATPTTARCSPPSECCAVVPPSIRSSSVRRARPAISPTVPWCSPVVHPLTGTASPGLPTLRTVFPIRRRRTSVNTLQRRKAALVAGLAALAARCRRCSSELQHPAAAPARQPPAERPRPPAARRRPRGEPPPPPVPRSPAPCQGSGSTFQRPSSRTPIDAFQKANYGTTVTYGGGGSGKGRTDLKNKVVDFAGSDSPRRPTPTSRPSPSSTSRSCSGRSPWPTTCRASTSCS